MSDERTDTCWHTLLTQRMEGAGGGYKPNSVPPLQRGGHSFIWRRPHGRAQAAYPGVFPLLVAREPAVGAVDSPIWPCSARGLPCPDPRGSSGGLLPHLFTLTRGLALRPPPGGVFSVALSLALPRLGVTQRAPTRSSDFPPRLHSADGASACLLRRPVHCTLFCRCPPAPRATLPLSPHALSPAHHPCRRRRKPVPRILEKL